jgi:hypothetical protein
MHTETIESKQTKERPILFSGEMVRAILDGRKTQTRRVVKPKPDDSGLWNNDKCPYGKPGDRLWVRETFFVDGPRIQYRADHHGAPKETIWKPSIFMPRHASRILLEIADVRCERLRDISEADAIAEGVASFRPVPGDGDPETLYANYMNKGRLSYRKAYFSFMTLWQSINGPESWNANPWVWVITFKRHTF